MAIASHHDHAIRVRGVWKSYTIASNAPWHTTLGDALIDRLKNPFRKIKKETFWALKDVSFELNKGDTVGIIGRNGAGKSTILKILSRITEPTKGEIELYGRIGSLLEVGTGFHQELTGRENVYLNGAILGMRKREIDKHFDAIVDFAGVEKFLDTPVKRYSSGMYVRLAFAVAAHLDCEIMVVDEVLAVGDSEFQNKCLGKMKDVATSGRTVLFVSHNMQAVSLLCNKAIFLKQGSISYQGATQTAITEYINNFAQSSELARKDPTSRPGSGEYRFTVATPSKQTFRSEEKKTIHYRIERKTHPMGQMYLAAHVVDEIGAVVAQCDSRLVGHYLDDTEITEGTFSFTTPWLKPGNYRIDLYICILAFGLVDCFEDACRIHISPLLPYPHSVADDGIGKGAVLGQFQWESTPASSRLSSQEARPIASSPA